MPKPNPLNGTALILEDNMIIALDAEDILLGLGVEQVLMATSVSEALGLINAHKIDFAVLDVNLGSETSETVGTALREGATPFVFVTGYSEDSDFGAAFPDTKIVQKPFDRESIASALGAI